MSQIVNINNCQNAFSAKSIKSKYVLLYQGKPFVLAIEPSNKDVASGLFSYGLKPNYEYNKLTKTFTDKTTGEYTVPVCMAKDTLNKSIDETKLEQVLGWMRHAIAEGIAAHEECMPCDILVDSLVTKAKEEGKADVLNLKCKWVLPQGQRYVKGVQIKPEQKKFDTIFKYTEKGKRVVESDPTKLVDTPFTGIYFVEAGAITASPTDGKYYMPLKLHTAVVAWKQAASYGNEYC